MVRPRINVAAYLCSRTPFASDDGRQLHRADAPDFDASPFRRASVSDFAIQAETPCHPVCVQVDWWARAFGLIAIAISLSTYWHGRPHLKLTVGTGLVFGLPTEGEMCACVTVTIANNGGAEVRVSDVNLIGSGLLVGKLIRGPKMPVEVKARGGRANWFFDYADMAQQLSDRAAMSLADGIEPVAVRASYRIGARVRSPRSAVAYINPPHATSSRHRTTLRHRAIGWCRSWSRPVPTLDAFALLKRDRFGARIQTLNVSNRFRRAAPSSELVLVVKHPDGKREVVAHYKSVPVPRIRGKRSIEVDVSFVDDSKATAGDAFQWVLKTRDGYGGQAVSANLLSEIPMLTVQMEEVKKREADRGDVSS
jgi:hypothetical protein